MNEELKPCPFCGGEAKVINRHVKNNGYAVIGCSNGCCRIRPTIPGRFLFSEAIELWNTRYEATCTMEKVLLYDEECIEGIECDEC